MSGQDDPRHQPAADLDGAALPDAVDRPVDGLVVRRLADVPREVVKPMFGGRLLVGKLAAIAGDAGVGKSYLTAALAADLTAGRALPGDEHPVGPADVLIASFEDEPGDTMRPRLEDLGADLTRVHVIDGVRVDGKMQPFGPGDVDALAVKLDELPDVRMLVVDPVGAWVGGGVDEYRANEVRAALEGLRVLAADRGVAVVLLMHLRKSQAASALNRLSGSGAYGQLVRSALLAGEDPDDAKAGALAHIKCNLTSRAPTLAYRIDDETFHWLGEREDLDGEQLAGHTEDGPAAGSEAEQFILSELATGPKPAKAMFAEAHAAGISEKTLKRAKRRLGVESRKQGLGGGWAWHPPEEGPKGAKGAKDESMAPLAPFEAPLADEGVRSTSPHDTTHSRPSPNGIAHDHCPQCGEPPVAGEVMHRPTCPTIRGARR